LCSNFRLHTPSSVGFGVSGRACGPRYALPRQEATEGAAEKVPAFAVDVVDTTGCGGAFSAGFVGASLVGRPPREAAVLGNAVAALVAQGLGGDHGDFDLAAADTYAKTTALQG
jgi:sugar/nucleoside kinase (ribokinase family)